MNEILSKYVKCIIILGNATLKFRSVNNNVLSLNIGSIVYSNVVVTYCI